MQAARIYLFLIALIFANCTPKQSKKLTEIQKNTSTEDTSSVALLESDTLLSTVPFTLKKTKLIAQYKTTSCYGVCPVYEVSFYENSQYALWRGYEDTNKLGLYEAQITESLLLEIKEKAIYYNFDQLESTYPAIGNFLEEYPSTVIYVHINEMASETTSIYDAPANFRGFNLYLKNIIDSLIWVKVHELD